MTTVQLLTALLALGCFVSLVLALTRMRALEAPETMNGIDRPARVSLPAEEWRGSIGIGWGRPKIRLVASRRDGFFSGDGAA